MGLGGVLGKCSPILLAFKERERERESCMVSLSLSMVSSLNSQLTPQLNRSWCLIFGSSAVNTTATVIRKLLYRLSFEVRQVGYVEWI